MCSLAGLSFCTALDDEEEMRSTQSPAEMGNALMKVLKIGGEERLSPGKDKAETSMCGNDVVHVHTSVVKVLQTLAAAVHSLFSLQCEVI